MNAYDAIANHLNIAEAIIAEVQEWAHVLFVRFVGRRPRFVSKKVVEDKAMTQEQLVEKMEEIGGRRWQSGDHDRMYFHGSLIAELLNLSNSKGRQINAAKFYYDLRTAKFFHQGVAVSGVTHYSDRKTAPWVVVVKQAVGLL